MASARIARLATEVAPPQFATAMRKRASKMLDTIPEEDSRDVVSDSFSLVAKKSASFLPHSVPKHPNSAFHGTKPSSSTSSMPPKHIFQAIKARVSTSTR